MVLFTASPALCFSYSTTKSYFQALINWLVPWAEEGWSREKWKGNIRFLLIVFSTNPACSRRIKAKHLTKICSCQTHLFLPPYRIQKYVSPWGHSAEFWDVAFWQWKSTSLDIVHFVKLCLKDFFNRYLFKIVPCYWFLWGFCKPVIPVCGHRSDWLYWLFWQVLRPQDGP